MGNKLALSALVLALVALLLHLLGPSGAREAVATTAVPLELRRLEARIEVLEAENEHTRETMAGLSLMPAAVPEREPASASDPKLDDLLQRVAELERRTSIQLGGREEGPETLTESARAEFLRHNTPGEDLQRAIDRAQDPSATEAERLQALRLLRGQRDLAGIDARLYVLDSMLELARTSRNGESRADVWRQFSHVTDRRLRQPLLDALAYDEHSKAREEAAETLEDFLPDLAVEAALRLAAENDADADVRRQAASSLTSRR